MILTHVMQSRANWEEVSDEIANFLYQGARIELKQIAEVFRMADHLSNPTQVSAPKDSAFRRWF